MKTFPKLGMLTIMAFMSFLLMSFTAPEETCQRLQCLRNTPMIEGNLTTTGVR